jgi:hypothetical protein
MRKGLYASTMVWGLFAVLLTAMPAQAVGHQAGASSTSSLKEVTKSFKDPGTYTLTLPRYSSVYGDLRPLTIVAIGGRGGTGKGGKDKAPGEQGGGGAGGDATRVRDH